MGTDDMTHVYTGVGHDGSTLHIVYTGWSHHDSPTLSFLLGGPSCCKFPLKVSIIFIQLASCPNFLPDCSDICKPFPHRLFFAH